MVNNEQFVSDYVPQVSRTFALAMQFLPERLRHSINSAYLLCRLVDTIEDSTELPVDIKIERLRFLQRLLLSYSEGSSFRSDDIAGIYSSIALDSSPDHKLLSESDKLFAIMSELPDNHRAIIYRWAGEMAGGMAEYVDLKASSDCSIITLSDMNDWDRYCYYVAGTVGRMLTELFIEELDLSNDEIAGLTKHSNSFGLGLQKVNTIKDIPSDRQRGIIFIPREIINKLSLNPDSMFDPERADDISSLTRVLVSLSRGHLDDAIEYIKLIPESENGIRMFLIVPVFLAASTLKLLYKNPLQAICGPPVKISRLEVVRLTSLAALCSTSNSRLEEHYTKINLE
jgi:farnesyl-diphosphate farnesyltransferase